MHQTWFVAVFASAKAVSFIYFCFIICIIVFIVSIFILFQIIKCYFDCAIYVKVTTNIFMISILISILSLVLVVDGKS